MIWIDSFLAIAMHELALAEGGGAEGLRDIGLLESALARPRQLLVYSGSKPAIPISAAAYARGLIRDHPFVDGNKRTAFLVSTAFCQANGYRFEAPDGEPVVIFPSSRYRRNPGSGLSNVVQTVVAGRKHRYRCSDFCLTTP